MATGTNFEENSLLGLELTAQQHCPDAHKAQFDLHITIIAFIL
jgi:hypothetical protein